MRLRAGIVALTVAAATIGGAAAWASTVVPEGPQPVRNQAAAAEAGHARPPGYPVPAPVPVLRRPAR